MSADLDSALLAAVARWRGIVAEMDALEGSCLGDDGYDEPRDDRVTRLCRSRGAAERRIARMPARTLAGMRAKAEVAMRSADAEGWGDVSPGDQAYVAYWLCRDLIAFAGDGAELRASLAKRRAARRRWQASVKAAQEAPLPPKAAEMERRRQEEAERLAALGWQGGEWTGHSVRMAIWLMQRLCLAGHVAAARDAFELVGPDVEFFMPADLKATLGIVTRH